MPMRLLKIGSAALTAVAAVLFAVISLPNMIWLIGNRFVAIDYAFERAAVGGGGGSLLNHFKYPWRSISRAAGVVLPSIAVLAALFFRRERGPGEEKTDPERRFQLLFLTFICWGPYALTLLFSLLTGGKINYSWVLPCFSLLPLYAVYLYRPVVKPYVYRMPDIMYAQLTESEYEIVADSLADQVEENYQAYLESLEKPMPFYIGEPQNVDGKLLINWETAYDFDNESISYDVRVATDYLYQNVVYSETNLRIPQIQIDMPPAGQYFVEVIARNESGKTQTAFDYYPIDGDKMYGTKCFYVTEDGSVEQYVEVEGDS